MPASGGPELSRQGEAWPIQLERGHRGSAYGCPAIDPRGALGPHEVLTPVLLSGIEDPHFAPGHRIDDEEAVALVIVAERTGKPQILFYCRPPSDRGN